MRNRKAGRKPKDYRANLGEKEIHGNGCIDGRIAVVTGASGGIGRAIALALASQGVRLCVVGRDRAALEETAAEVRPFSKATCFFIDLTLPDKFTPLVEYLQKEAGRLDILIHAAGVARQDLMEHSRIEDLDLQYATNVRAPYVVTQLLLPLLTAARGQIVFINSSVGLAARRPETGQYSATKHALKAIADSLREEVNQRGIRVLTIYLGRTATPMQEAIYRKENKVYQPGMLLQPEDVASLVVQALMLPSTAEVTDISIRSMQKSY